MAEVCVHAWELFPFSILCVQVCTFVCVPKPFAGINSNYATNLQKDHSRREDTGTYIKGTYWHMLKPKSFLIT